MKLTKSKIKGMRGKFLEAGSNPTTLIINPDDYKDSFLKQTIFGMEIIVTNDCEKNKVYIIDKTKIFRVKTKPKKKTLWQKIIERIRGIIRIIKYGDIE